MHGLHEGELTGLSVWEVSMRGLPPSISAFFVFLSRCTMSSALPWSAVIRYVPCTSSTASISFCRHTTAESIFFVSAQIPALEAAAISSCYDISSMLPVVCPDEAGTLYCLPSPSQHLHISKGYSAYSAVPRQGRCFLSTDAIHARHSSCSHSQAKPPAAHQGKGPSYCPR